MLVARLFNRISQEKIQNALADLGVRRGDSILALVSLRSLGYAQGGARAVVEALLSVVGVGGNVMMPSFPALDPLPALAPSSSLDEAETPSAAGLVSEAFRLRPGTLRSLHPVGAVTAVGPKAAGWLEGHEKLATPFAPASPIDRFVASKGRILIIGAHAGPILPYIQERVGFPNLYQPQVKEVAVRARDGRYMRVTTRLFRSKSCRIVILQGNRPETRDFVLMRDYALVFPAARQRSVAKGGYLRHNRGRLLGRIERLRQRGILRSGMIGQAEAVLVEAAPFCDQVSADLEWEIARFKDEYDPEKLENIDLQ